MTAAVLLLSCVQAATLTSADPDASVAAGRDALHQSWWRSYPWYDSSTDGVARVEVPKPRKAKRDSWNRGAGWSSSLLQWLGWIAIAVLLAGLAYLMLRAFGRKRRLRSDDVGDDAADAAEDRRRVGALPPAAARGRFDLLAEARRRYQQGDYRQAIVYLFGYQLDKLDKQDLIRLAKGKTNRQYLRELDPRTALRTLVEQTMVAFEDVFFGGYAIDRARFDSCWTRLAEFETLVAEEAV